MVATEQNYAYQALISWDGHRNEWVLDLHDICNTRVRHESKAVLEDILDWLEQKGWV